MGEDIFDKSIMVGSSIYELFTGLSRRVSRVYLKHGKPYLVNSLIAVSYTHLDVYKRQVK